MKEFFINVGVILSLLLIVISFMGIFALLFGVFSAR